MMKLEAPPLVLLRRAVRRLLTPSQRASLKRFRERFGHRFGKLGAAACSADLPALATLYGSDKWGSHWYAKHYAKHFEHWRHEPIKLLEIGIGGYANPKAGGASLRMWKSYFPRAEIYGIDLYDKRPHDEPRIRTFQGSQVDEHFLREVIAQIGRPHIIIDDGSHLNEHVIKTFEFLFPLLADNGIYAVEDTQTAYWPTHGGSSDLACPSTSMAFLTRLVHGLNWQEFIHPGYGPSDFDLHIVAMHFYHNLVFVHKGINNEGSVTIQNNLPPAAPEKGK
jgi:hypothetical protein